MRAKIKKQIKQKQYTNSINIIYEQDNGGVRDKKLSFADNRGLSGHTAQVEVPVSLGLSYAIIPVYRYYNQSAVDYFAGFEEHLSTQEYYTSDYDLSAFHSHMIGLGFRHKDIFSKFRVWRVGFKQTDLRYNYYSRSTGLDAHIISMGAGFAMLPKKK